MKNMRATLSFALLAAVAFALLGCNNSGANLVGSWKGKFRMPTPPAGSNQAANDMAKGLASAFSGAITLDLNADHTFKMTMIFPFEGNWSASGTQLTLTMTKMMGMSVDDLKKQAQSNGMAGAAANNNKPMVFDISADGKTLTPAEGDKSKGTFVLTKG